MRYGQIMRCARSNPISVLYVMAYILYYKYEKKEDIWLSHMTKAPTPIEKSKKQRDNYHKCIPYTSTSI